MKVALCCLCFDSSYYMSNFSVWKLFLYVSLHIFLLPMAAFFSWKSVKSSICLSIDQFQVHDVPSNLLEVISEWGIFELVIIARPSHVMVFIYGTGCPCVGLAVYTFMCSLSAGGFIPTGMEYCNIIAEATQC